MGNCCKVFAKVTKQQIATKELTSVKKKKVDDDAGNLKAKLIQTESEQKKAKEITPKASVCGIKDITKFIVVLGNGTGRTDTYWGDTDTYEMTMDEIKANLFEIACGRFQSEIDGVKNDFRLWITNLSNEEA